jgi:hypothetical protein
MFKWFKKHEVTILDEKWNIVKQSMKVTAIPRTHELIFLTEYDKYYRVVNVVYNFSDTQHIYVIIEEYTDDFNILEKKV